MYRNKEGKRGSMGRVGRESKAGEREYGGRENEAGVTRAAFRCLVGDCHYCPFRNSQSWLE